VSRALCGAADFVIAWRYAEFAVCGINVELYSREVAFVRESFNSRYSIRH
jgi:hypothetical protein